MLEKSGASFPLCWTETYKSSIVTITLVPFSYTPFCDITKRFGLHTSEVKLDNGKASLTAPITAEA